MSKIGKIILIFVATILLFSIGLVGSGRKDVAFSMVYEVIDFFGLKHKLPHYPNAERLGPIKITFNKNILYISHNKSKSSISQIINFFTNFLDREGKKSYKEVTPSFGMFGFANGEIGKSVVAFRNQKTGITNFFTGWVDGKLNLELDAHGDAPGQDLKDIPRYPGSKRLFDIEQKGAGFESAILMYQSQTSLSGILNFYKSQMPRRGWQLNPTFNEASEKSAENILFFQSEKKECYLSIEKDEDDESTWITIVYKNVL